MSLHETKICPRCSNPFFCKPGNITQCKCFGIPLTTEQKAYIEQRYPDCLCKNCLAQLQNEVELFKEKFIYRYRK
ncbi:MAG TPA: cysteine-rich CWC family protein [Chitinophagaceae bacterium]|nr:cysteine-rich CWC family protein [Chitinophagales bacterium]HPG10255.1 cysteine-rich CWC family protein [Chitinophagaceae bacterium]